MEYRYKGIELTYMTKIQKDTTFDGHTVIYVQECKEFDKKEWKRRKTLDKLIKECKVESRSTIAK